MRTSEEYVDLLRPLFNERNTSRVYTFWYTEAFLDTPNNPRKIIENWSTVDSKFHYAIDVCSKQDPELKHWIDVDICRQIIILFQVDLVKDKIQKWRNSNTLRDGLNWDPDRIRKAKPCQFLIELKELAEIAEQLKSGDPEDGN